MPKLRGKRISADDRDAIIRIMHDCTFLYNYVCENEPNFNADINVSAVARRLAFDHHSIIQRVAKILKVPVLYVPIQYWKAEGDIPYDRAPEIYKYNLDKVIKPGGHASFIKPNTFSNYSLGVLNKITITPKTIVRLYAHKLGGVHYDPSFRTPRPREKDEDKIFRIIEQFRDPVDIGIPNIMTIRIENGLHHNLKKAVGMIYHTTNCLCHELRQRKIVTDNKSQ